jgi:cation transport regulator ChaB
MVFDLIAPELQTELPWDQIPEYAGIQRQFSISHGRHVPSRQSLDVMGNTVQREMFIEAMQVISSRDQRRDDQVDRLFTAFIDVQSRTESRITTILDVVERADTIISQVHATTAQLQERMESTQSETLAEVRHVITEHDRIISAMIAANRTPQIRDRHANLHG